MPTAPALVTAHFEARPNRFVVRARLGDGMTVEAHLGDPGRLHELLVPGVELRLRPAPPDDVRRTSHTVALVRASTPSRPWVSLETARANALAREVIEGGSLRGTGHGWHIASEVRSGSSRFDFLLTRGDRRFWIEVKQATCLVAGTALFPDAPSARGRRHLRELLAHAGAGDRAGVLFVVPRADARAVAPYRAIDPEFADLLDEARRGGVTVDAARFRLDAAARATFESMIPVVPA